MRQLDGIKNQIEFRYNVPYQNFNHRDVFGKFMKLFKIKDPARHAVALETAAAGKLYNVVVRNERVSKELI